MHLTRRKVNYPKGPSSWKRSRLQIPFQANLRVSRPEEEAFLVRSLTGFLLWYWSLLIGNPRPFLCLLRSLDCFKLTSLQATWPLECFQTGMWGCSVIAKNGYHSAQEPVSPKSRNFSGLFRVPQFPLYLDNAEFLRYQPSFFFFFFFTLKTF